MQPSEISLIISLKALPDCVTGGDIACKSCIAIHASSKKIRMILDRSSLFFINTVIDSDESNCYMA